MIFIIGQNMFVEIGSFMCSRLVRLQNSNTNNNKIKERIYRVGFSGCRSLEVVTGSVTSFLSGGSQVISST